MNITSDITTTVSKDVSQPLLDLVISQSYSHARLKVMHAAVSKYPASKQTHQRLYFSSVGETNNVTVHVSYCMNAKEAHKELFASMALWSAPAKTIVRTMEHVENGPGDLCIASRDGSLILFTRGNAFVQIACVKGCVEKLIDVARWLDAQFARLSSNAAALKAADPCETNDMSFASFIVYDIPEPNAKPRADDAE